ncbi:MAG: DUF5808 domain-containing protein [Myxococcales bacterium]
MHSTGITERRRGGGPLNARQPQSCDGASPRGPGILVQAGPFGILAAAALWLGAHWEELPQRLPMHWNARFEADSFAPRSPLTAALPLLIGSAVCLMLLAMQAGIKRSAPDGALRAFTLKTLVIGEYFTALICCGVLAASVTNGRLLKPVLALSLAGVLGLLVFVWVSARRVPREATRNPSAWRGGVFYVDREDPALFVPKRYGLGYTFNYGHPAALPITVALLLVPLAIVAGVMLFR